MISFKLWLRYRDITDDPAGDFIADAGRDLSFPDVRTWRELCVYLRKRNASEEAVDAARQCWNEYCNFERDAEHLRSQAHQNRDGRFNYHPATRECPNNTRSST